MPCMRFKLSFETKECVDFIVDWGPTLCAHWALLSCWCRMMLCEVCSCTTALFQRHGKFGVACKFTALLPETGEVSVSIVLQRCLHDVSEPAMTAECSLRWTPVIMIEQCFNPLGPNTSGTSRRRKPLKESCLAYKR